MQFSFDEGAGENLLELSGDEFRHIFKARRKDSKEPLVLRNLKDEFEYTYKCLNISRNKATLELLSRVKKSLSSSFLHLSWAVVEPKIVEKTLPFLNELGVSKLSFVYTEFSQRNFHLDTQRMKRILISSCEQCGRSTLMDLEFYESLQAYLKIYPTSYILDFGGANILKTELDNSPVLVGCEGGFSSKEREFFKQDRVLGLKSKFILKSQTAIISLATLGT